MEWNNRQQILQICQPFTVQQVQSLQHQQIQEHTVHTQHQQHEATIPQLHALHQPSQPLQQPQPKVNRTGGSITPHCLICNVHLGMFAKGGMEVFSDKVITNCGKQQVHHILGAILNQELSTTSVHSTIVCKKCFKLLDDIDTLEGQLVGMKQVVSSKYTMTVALVKKGLVGKAVFEEQLKQQQQELLESPTKSPKKVVRSSIAEKGLKGKGGVRRGRPPKAGRLRKGSKLTVKEGRLVVKGVPECYAAEVEMKVDGPAASDEEEFFIRAMEVVEESEGEADAATCTICHKQFDSQAVLVSHMDSHSLDGHSLSCDMCDKSFFSADSLIKHKKLHKGRKKTLTTKSSCQAFDIMSVKHFKCEQCNKVFSTKSKAEDHERTHTGEKPFECDICGTCFRQKSNLSSHKRVTHLQEKRYKCELCDKAFKWKRLLKGHTMSVHTGERPYKCEYCEAGFVYQQHFKKHMRIHTGEKPYKCVVCGKAFNTSNNCRAHTFTHSDKKPYECSVCGAGFMRKALVLAHIRQHGSLEVPEDYVKCNSPATAIAATGEAGVANTGLRTAAHTTVTVRKKKVAREVGNSGGGGVVQVVHATPSQQPHIEEGMQEFIIPASHEAPATSGGETMGYMFTFQTQGHYTPLNLGQW